MIIPPLPTPFDQNGRLDSEAFRALAQAIEPHVDGLLFYGSNGEGVHLTREERAAGLAVQTPQKPAMVGLMEETLAQAAIALEEAARLGAKVLVTPPATTRPIWAMKACCAISAGLPTWAKPRSGSTMCRPTPKPSCPCRWWLSWPSTPISVASRTPVENWPAWPSTLRRTWA